MTKLGDELLEAAKEMVRLATEREKLAADQVRELDDYSLSPADYLVPTPPESLSEGSGGPIDTPPVPSITQDLKSVLESISEALVTIAHNTERVAEMMEAQYFLMAHSMGMKFDDDGMDTFERPDNTNSIVLVDEDGNEVEGEMSSDQTDRFSEGFFAGQRKQRLQ